MSTSKLAQLAKRGVVRASGADTIKLLDGLVTNSLARLEQQTAIHTGLLSPQGKILFDFFVVPDGDDLLFDVQRDQIGELIKRLQFYRLRAAVEFCDESEQLTVAVAWGGNDISAPGGVIVFADPRNDQLGLRMILPRDRLRELAGDIVEETAYHAHRIEIGVPDAGLDYALTDTFPHEALYDELSSVDFRKGCFIGQEVVSRMQHRGSARKRIIPVVGEGALTPDAEITAGDSVIGRIGSVSDTRALALVRLDRADEAKHKGVSLTAGGVALSLAKPLWMKLDIATGKTAEQS
ncbi:MAG: YgfZ/GcvT domain-containing protein [Hyphomicrobiaceae bacterium]